MRLLLILAVVILFFGSPYAQVHVGVNINIGSQPVWGPVGYDYAEYYYFPDIDIFYYVPTRRFVCWKAADGFSEHRFHTDTAIMIFMQFIKKLLMKTDPI